MTNDAEEFVLLDRHIGHYNNTAQATGLKETNRNSVVLKIGDRTRVDFKMQLGAATEGVTVEADTVDVRSDRTRRGE